MTEEPRLRLFVAASLPADQLEWLEDRGGGLKRTWPQARWTVSANRHLTLKFLGATDAGLLRSIEAACGDAATEREPAEVRLDGLGIFPSPRRARVLWVGLDDPSGLLPSLAGALDRMLAPLGYASEKRRFSPHVTLARFREPVAVGPLPALPDPPPAFELGSIGLWRSRLSPKGATYELIRDFALGSSGAP